MKSVVMVTVWFLGLGVPVSSIHSLVWLCALTGIRAGYSTEPGGEICPELLPLGISLESEDVDCPMLSFY